MAKSSGGFRTRTRRKLKKKIRDKFTVEKYLQEFKAGDRVIIKIDSASQKSMPHFRYQGAVGTVNEKRGRGYVVSVKLGNKPMTITTKPEHLKGV
jgi:large subunit ribosomal protein L21e